MAREHASSPPDRSAAKRRLAAIAGVTALLACHWWWAVSAEIGKTVAYDETAHLTGGYSYWKFDDYRLHTENGNLPQRWAALPLLATDPAPRLEPSDDELLWHNSHVWGIAQHFLFGSGNNTDYLLLEARATMALWSVATGLLVFLWSRRLWGSAGGWVSLGLFAISPTMLAHGPLVTSDVCAAFWLLAATGAWWRLTERITPARLALAAGASGLAAVAKFSAVLLAPIFVAIAIWRLVARESVTAALGRTRPDRAFPSFRGKLAAIAAAGAVVCLGTWAVVWTFFGWRFSAFAPQLPEAWKFYIPWDELLAAAGVWRGLIEWTLRWHLLPEAYIEGFAHLNFQGAGRSAFLLGNYSNTGWWWFFPYAFLAKSSLAELGAVGLAAAVGFGRLLHAAQTDWRKRLAPFVPLIAFVAIYGAFAMLSPLNIGHRHILPVYPALFIVAGALAGRSAPRWMRRLAPALLLLGVVETVAARPNYLAFFNRAVGGPANGWRQLVDSSLDWGQDLPGLAVWLRQSRSPGEEVYVSYFGNGDLPYEGIDAHELAGVYAYNRTLKWVDLGPGIYAISATMLQAVYNPWRGPWTLDRERAYVALRAQLSEPAPADAAMEERSGLLKTYDDMRFARLSFYLRARRPDAVIADTIFIFRLTPAEIATVVNGSLAELAEAMSQASENR